MSTTPHKSTSSAEAFREVPILIINDPEIDCILQENRTDIEGILHREGISFRSGNLNSLPSDMIADRQGTKEATTIVFCGAAVAIALAPILKKLIDAFTNRPIVVEEAIWLPVESSSGDVIRDSSGAPIIKRVIRHRLLDTQRKTSEKVTLEGPMEIKIKYETTVC